MRKIKKINGYLVVKFNDRELREYEGSALGEYGVIDAELYTGCLDIDRGAMEYDDAGSLEEAVELARGLDSEEDFTGPKPTVTVIKETDDSTEEDAVDTQLMIAGWETVLSYQIESSRYPDVTPATARHELYGYMVALKELGMIEPDECFVEPHHFEPESIPDIKPETFAHLPPEKRGSGTARSVYSLGLVLAGDCPENDCHLYLNIFNMCREIDKAINQVEGWPREVLEMELNRKYIELETMFTMNYAIRQYKRGTAGAGEKKEPPEERTAPQTDADALERHLRRQKQIHDETRRILNDLANGIPHELTIDTGRTDNTPYYPGKPGPSSYISERFVHGKRE